MEAVLPLFGLALLDSLSAGTLVIPLMLVLRQRRADVRPLTIYFLTVCTSYFLLGVAIQLGFEQARDWLMSVLESDPAYWAQLLVGVVLFLWGVTTKDPEKGAPMQVSRPKSLATGAVFSLALGAVVIEAATMVPYLAAIAILGTLEIAMGVRFAILALYCLVMVLPALLAIALFSVFGDRIWHRLERFLVWVERETKITLLWLAAIIGFFMTANAVQHLGLFG